MTRAAVLAGLTALAMADHRLIVPKSDSLILPPDIRRRREMELRQSESTNTNAAPAKELTALDIDAITAAHHKRMRKAGFTQPPAITIAVSEMAPAKPCRFETDIGVVFFMSPEAFAEMTGGAETEHAKADAESTGLIGLVNGVPVVDMDAPTERAVAVGIAISTALGKYPAK